MATTTPRAGKPGVHKKATNVSAVNLYESDCASVLIFTARAPYAYALGVADESPGLRRRSFSGPTFGGAVLAASGFWGVDVCLADALTRTLYLECITVNDAETDAVLCACWRRELEAGWLRR